MKKYIQPQSSPLSFIPENMLALSNHDEEGNGIQLSNSDNNGWSSENWNTEAEE